MKNPLNLPEGSVRAILAIFSIVVIIGGYVTSIFVANISFPAELVAVATFILGFYFHVREK